MSYALVVDFLGCCWAQESPKTGTIHSCNPMLAISRLDRLNDNQGTAYLSAIPTHGSAHGTLDAMMAGRMHHHHSR